MDGSPSPKASSFPSPHSASLFSKLTCSWFNPFLAKGYSGTLSEDDFFPLNPEDGADCAARQLEANWNHVYAQLVIDPKEEGFKSDLKRIIRVWKVLIRSFGWTYAAGAVLELLQRILSFAYPILLKMFLEFMGNTDEPLSTGYFIAALFFLQSTASTILQQLEPKIVDSATRQTTSGFKSLLYRKALSMDCSTRSQTTSGDVINLLTSDAPDLSSLVSQVNSLWLTPIEIGLALILLTRELGMGQNLVPLVLTLALIPLTFWIGSKAKESHKRRKVKRKERIKTLNELLLGIRVVKFYGWEVPFQRKIADLRAEEMREIQLQSYIDMVRTFILSCGPLLVSLATFSLYLLSAEQSTLDSSKVFVSLSLFGLLRSPLTSLPHIWTSLGKLAVSVKKVEEFLNGTMVSYVTRNEDEKAVVRIEDGSFAWGKEKEPVLKRVNLKIASGSLVAIVGPVGSGKSSLLAAILGEMERITGTVNVDRDAKIGYVAQTAWIRNATVRENILFGSPYDELHYQSVLKMCALQSDLAILPAGDQTEIGEKGVNLSGGQKARVALARAVYSRASLALLDDPLSAVDAHVGQHIFSHVLSNTTGALKDETRILVTNNLSLLPQFNQIVFLSAEHQIQDGTFTELLSKSAEFADLIAKHQGEHPEVDSLDSELPSEPKEASIGSESDSPDKGQLTEPEVTSTKRVSFSVYVQYLRSMTFTLIFLCFLCHVADDGFHTGSKIWLAVWSSENSRNSSESNPDSPPEEKQSLSWYALLGLGQVFFFCLSKFTQVRGGLKSSLLMHGKLLDRLVHYPMAFFDTTPIGRILNLFTANMSTIDRGLPSLLSSFFSTLIDIIGKILLISVQIPVFLFVFPPVSLLYFAINKYSNATSRQIDRLWYTTSSPILSHFHETLAGLTTIRAFERQSAFIETCSAKIDANAQLLFHMTVCYEWKSIRTETIGNLISLAVTTILVASRETMKGRPGFAGLLLNHSVSFQTMQYLISMVRWFDSSLMAVQRVNEFSAKQMEAEWNCEEADEALPDDWPTSGRIEFVDYSVRYRDGLELVLKKINLKIAGGEKVGIVGRTGAGKSSLALGLFRILEAAEGKIEIDGVDVKTVGLHTLRHRMAIIPQDPVLFSGTIRSNLDPFGVHRDEVLYQALADCHLGSLFASPDSGLEQVITENGANLSLGQRQLLCLARALLRGSRILLLDEATAAMDLATDGLVQETIGRAFSHATVLTIAHRLHSILDSDRVLVLDQGKVAEFDTPTRLLANRESLFYSLAKSANIV